jgi:hypothetical protein
MLVRRWSGSAQSDAKYPKAVAKLDKDWDALTAFYDFPARSGTPNVSAALRLRWTRGRRSELTPDPLGPPLGEASRDVPGHRRLRALGPGLRRFAGRGWFALRRVAFARTCRLLGRFASIRAGDSAL